ncbi:MULTISPECIES: transcription termination/antitermination protein NusG [Hallerella]|uniref:Transcription termination/antitermination protein NusG n=2 Tax=Hallerella succinigenes TaxID=1896222 RepID=A0A2M9A6X3_9BACT|nr:MULTISPECIES: transcription termination/antitermination protein NusG [Hallerella]MCI6874028.1 transcription termination/antitermination protein NusG [Hallerella sp.]MDD6091724.1 transcription termination/antitermination protein NusG [Hallerella succinigenes]PJJ41471.1 transcription antitermination protein nusG [Hallerella succinigenes]
MAMLWYAVHTFSGQESTIKKNIEMLIEREGVQEKFGRILIPEKVTVVNVRGKRKNVVSKLFPAYLIIEMELDELTQHLVTSVQGVTHFGGTSRVNKTPIPLRQSEVDRLLGVESQDAEQDVIQNPYIVGDHVSIKDGPFQGFDGTVEEILTEKNKLRVTVSVFGRATPVELGFNQVESIS